MESQSQNPEFRNNPENFHPCNVVFFLNLQVTKDLCKITLHAKTIICV